MVPHLTWASISTILSRRYGCNEYVLLVPFIIASSKPPSIGQENLEDLSIRNVVQALPQSNFDILRGVSEHLDKYAILLSDFYPYLPSTRVTDCEEHNHMTAKALVIVFGPNLLRAPQNIS